MINLYCSFTHTIFIYSHNFVRYICIVHLLTQFFPLIDGHSWMLIFDLFVVFQRSKGCFFPISVLPWNSFAYQKHLYYKILHCKLTRDFLLNRYLMRETNFCASVQNSGNSDILYRHELFWVESWFGSLRINSIYYTEKAIGWYIHIHSRTHTFRFPPVSLSFNSIATSSGQSKFGIFATNVSILK